MAGPTGDVPAALMTRRRRWEKIFVPGIPALVALALGVWGAGGLSLWRDEGMSVLVARRSVPDILRFVSHLDAVHGAYYFLLHWVIVIFGTDEFVLRLPSILAFAAAAAGTAVLGRRLISPWGGLLAGSLYAGAPMANWYAHDVRPYALATALAVLATVLFVRAVEVGTRSGFACYGAVVFVLGAIHLFALLVVAAHVSALLVTRSRHLRRCAVTLGVAGGLLSPLMIVEATQSHVLEYLDRPGFGDVLDLAAVFSGSWSLLIPMGLAVLGGAWFARPRSPLDVRALAIPWLVLPAAVLMLASQVHPCYQGRYVIASLPAVALLAAAGLARLPRGSGVVPLVVIAAMVVTPQLRQRDPGRWPDQLREAATIVVRNSRTGDAVVWLPTNRRAVGEVYPGAFGRLRDVTMAMSPTRAENFGGTDLGPAEVVRRLQDPAVPRVWLVEGEVPWRGPALDPVDHAKINTLERNFRPIGQWRVRGLTLTLYAK